MMILVLFVLMFFFMFAGIPIFAAMSAASVIYLLLSGNASLDLVSTSMVQGLSAVNLLAIPFFILIGELMNLSGMTRRVINLAEYFVAKVKGGLAYAAIFVNLLLGAITGSAPANASAVSPALIPEMNKRKYPLDLSASVNASAAILGPIIPPSIPLVFLALVTDLSTGRMLLGGLLPGLLLVVALIIITKLNLNKIDLVPDDTSKKTFTEFKSVLRDSILALTAPLIIVVGVITGFVTVTEVAILASGYIIIIGVFFYRTINIKNLIGAFKKTAATASVLMMLFGVVGIFSWFVAVEQIPDMLLGIIQGLNLSPAMFMLFTLIILLITGMIMDAIPAITILMPILMPVAMLLGIDPIHYGVVVVVTLMIGLLTPPLGALLFVETKLANISFNHLAKAVMPYVMAFIVVAFIVAYVSPLATAIPNLFFGGG